MSMKQLVGSSGFAEHPAEFQVADALLEAADVGGDGVQRRVVGVRAGQLEQLAAVADSGVERHQRGDDAFERFALLREFLRALLVVPDLRVFELPDDLFEPHRLHFEVKDTSAGRRCAL